MKKSLNATYYDLLGTLLDEAYLHKLQTLRPVTIVPSPSWLDLEEETINMTLKLPKYNVTGVPDPLGRPEGRNNYLDFQITKIEYNNHALILWLELEEETFNTTFKLPKYNEQKFLIP